MLKFINKRKGAISIFLVIVLVPMLVLSAVMIDMSRVNLGRGMAASAGDLAANTTLTNYNYDLKEFYGLMASASNQDEFFATVKQYYKDTLISAGLDEKTADEYSEGATNIVKNADLEKISIGDDDITISSLNGKNGTLLNPAVTKTQIVNFMKYRAPIDMGTSIIDAIDLFKTMGKKTKLIEAKNKFYEEYAGIIDLLQEARNKIGEYEKIVPENDVNGLPNPKYLNDTLSNLKNDYSYIKSIVDPYVRYYYLCDYFDLTKYDVNDIDLTYDSNKGIISWTESAGGKEIDENPSATYENTQKIIDNIREYINGSTVYRHVSSINSDEKKYVTYVEQFFFEYVRGSGLLRLCEDYYSNLLHLYSLEKGGSEKGEESDETGDTSEQTQSVEPQKLTIYSGGGSVSCTATQVITNYYTFGIKELSEVLVKCGRVQHANNAVKSEMDGVNNILSEIRKDINKRRNNISNKKNLLDKEGENPGDRGLIQVLDLITEKMNAIDNAMDEWSKAANDNALSKDSMASSDKEEIKRIKEYINENDIAVFKKKTKASKGTLKGVITNMDKYKVADDTYLSVSANSFKSIYESEYTDEKSRCYADISELDARIAVILGELSKPNDVKTTWPGDESPKLNNPEKPFYKYLIDNYKVQENAQDASESKDESDDNKDKFKNKADEVQGKRSGGISCNNDADAEDLPSKIWDGGAGGNFSDSGGNMDTEADKALSNTSSLMDTIFAGVADAIKGARDNFYITDYAVKMFSYNTLEAELSDKNEGKSEDKKQKAVTLTNQDINGDNNYLYGKEVEYLLYGNDEPVVKTYATIYAIRFASNVIYAFTDAELNALAQAIALAIFGTPPLTALVPLAKIAIIVGAALVESAIDIMYLSQGKAIPLYKSKDTWMTSVSGAAKVVGDVVEEGVDAGMDYVDNLLNQSSETIDDLIKEGSTELSDAINGTIDSRVDEYITQTVSSFFDICSSSLVKESNKKEKYVKEKLDEWAKNTDMGSDFANSVKNKAVDKIKSSVNISDAINSFSGDAEKSIKDKIDEVKKQVTDSVTSAIDSGADALTAQKNQLIDKLKDSARSGGESLKSELKSQLGEKFGAGNVTQSSGGDSALGTLLSWRYSNYLELFLVIGLITNENNILLRMEDLIQLNMKKKTESFSMEKSYVYYNFNAKIRVKPLLTTIPLINNSTKDKLTGDTWYTVNYSKKFGY